MNKDALKTGHSNLKFEHILFTYPYRQDLKQFGFFPPLGLEYIASVAHPYCNSLDIIDLRHNPKKTCDFIKPNTEAVCFSVNWDLDREFIIKEINSVNSAVIIVGGRCASEDPKWWFDNCPDLDAVVRGDGEEIIAEICQGKPWSQIDGLSFRHQGRIQHNQNRHPGPISDQLRPFRNYKRPNYEITLNGIKTGLQFDTIAASRGCPFNCNFCSFSRNPWGVKRKWSARSPESIIVELKDLEAPLVAFTDDIFTYDVQRVERICDLIIENGINKKFIINARLEIAKHPEVIEKMERAGFMILLVGIESAYDKTLLSMRKGFDTAAIREYFTVLRKSKIFTHGYFILGNIGESIEEMRYIGKFARQIGVDSISLSTLRNSPYSGLDELVAANPEYHIGKNERIYSDHCSAKQLRHIRRQINRDFYSPSHIMHLIGKSFHHGFWRLLGKLIISLPLITGTAIANSSQKRKRKRIRRQKKTIIADSGAVI